MDLTQSLSIAKFQVDDTVIEFRRPCRVLVRYCSRWAIHNPITCAAHVG